MKTRRKLAVVAVVAGLATGVCYAQPDPPLVTSPAWFTWYQDLLALRLAECPVARGTTYYFSQAGNDVSGNGSEANPWKTIAKAKQVLVAAAPAGDVAVLFRRGDVWRETVGIDVGTPNITIGDYGVGAKPLWTVFQSVGDPALWMPTPGQPNVYQRPAPVQVTCAKQDEDLDRPWSRQKTIAGANATEGSWCWKKGILYVHPRHGPGGVPTDPRIDGNAYEVVAIPDNLAGPGVRVFGDRTRVQNLRAQGWGITVQLGTQLHAFESFVGGSDRTVFSGLEAHYGLSHVITHVSISGGIATYVDCKAGLMTYSAGGGETIFNTFSLNGGNQTIFDHCEATHGTLPSDDFAPSQRKGVAVYGHTGAQAGAWLGLTIANACKVRDTKWGCTNGAGFSDVTPATTLGDVRCFIMGEQFEGGIGTGEFWRLGNASAARVNGVYSFRPAFIGIPTMNNYGRGWVINCDVELDCTDQAGDYSFYYGSPGLGSDVQLWNCYIGIKTKPGQAFRFDGAMPANSAQAAAFNSVIVATGGGTCATNFNSPGSSLRANAYYGVASAETAADPLAVILNQPLSVADRISCNSPLACRATGLPGGIVLGFDRTGTVAWRNDIGPIEVPWCGNCDQTTTVPMLTANDFQCFLDRFVAGDPEANCDGSTGNPTLTANDFQCFLDAYVRACN